MEKKFKVSWKYGKTEVCVDIDQRVITGFSKVSAKVISQILARIQHKMSLIFGNYDWTLGKVQGGMRLLPGMIRELSLRHRGELRRKPFSTAGQLGQFLKVCNHQAGELLPARI